MKTTSLFLCLVFVLCSQVFAGEVPSENPPKKSSIGLNLLQTATMFTSGYLLNGGGDGGGFRYFLPIHLNAQFSLNETWAIAAGAIYRWDNHGTFDNYNEFGAMGGLRYNFSKNYLNGFYASLQIGLGSASGDLSSSGLNYSAFEFLVQPEVGYGFNLSSSLRADVGAGILAFIPISSKNEIDWSTIGTLVHRLHPIANFTISYQF